MTSAWRRASKSRLIPLASPSSLASARCQLHSSLPLGAMCQRRTKMGRRIRCAIALKRRPRRLSLHGVAAVSKRRSAARLNARNCASFANMAHLLAAVADASATQPSKDRAVTALRPSRPLLRDVAAPPAALRDRRRGGGRRRHSTYRAPSYTLPPILYIGYPLPYRGKAVNFVSHQKRKSEALEQGPPRARSNRSGRARA